MKMPDPVEFCSQLLRLDTTTGREAGCVDFLSSVFEELGFSVRVQPFGSGFKNLVAELGPDVSSRRPLCFSAHVDTVPFDPATWTVAPLGGDVRDGKIYGRGASDMKGGIAAMASVAVGMSFRAKDLRAKVKFVASSAEEIGCLGARALSLDKAVLGEAGAMVICEPTSNQPCLGHKGALWLEVSAKGVAAHASMPEKGVNAIMKAVAAVDKISKLDFGVPVHPMLGLPTCNVGTISGGRNINSVPDFAVVGMDFRTLPGQSHDQLLDMVRGLLADDVECRPLISAESIMTDSSHPWVAKVYDVCSRNGVGGIEPRGVSYFTDGSYLTRSLGGIPVVILGPGEPEAAHKTDEFCGVDKIRQAAQIYTDLAMDWCL